MIAETLSIIPCILRCTNNWQQQVSYWLYVHVCYHCFWFSFPRRVCRYVPIFVAYITRPGNSNWPCPRYVQHDILSIACLDDLAVNITTSLTTSQVPGSADSACGDTATWSQLPRVPGSRWLRAGTTCILGLIMYKPLPVKHRSITPFTCKYEANNDYILHICRLHCTQ